MPNNASYVNMNMSEKQFQDLVNKTAKTLGWLHYHPYDSRKSTPGFPDLTLVRERLLFAELKVGKNKLSQAQRDWRECLERAGQEVYVWYPEDWDDIVSILTKWGGQINAQHSQM